jgi:hypothetical protein
MPRGGCRWARSSSSESPSAAQGKLGQPPSGQRRRRSGAEREVRSAWRWTFAVVGGRVRSAQSGTRTPRRTTDAPTAGRTLPAVRRGAVVPGWCRSGIAAVCVFGLLTSKIVAGAWRETTRHRCTLEHTEAGMSSEAGPLSSVEVCFGKMPIRGRSPATIIGNSDTRCPTRRSITRAKKR